VDLGVAKKTDILSVFFYAQIRAKFRWRSILSFYKIAFQTFTNRIYMAKLIFNKDEEIPLEDGSPIKEACEEVGVPFACEEGVCGTCVIEVEEGMENLSDFTQEEEDFLGEMGCERLACQCKIKSGLVKIKF
jgi:ferredoxin